MDLPLSGAIKLREVFKSDVVLNLLEETKFSLWFYEDNNLLASYFLTGNIRTILIKHKLAIEIFSQLQNVSEIPKALTIACEDASRIGVN